MVYKPVSDTKPFLIAVVFFLLIALGAFSLLNQKVNTRSLQQTLTSDGIYLEQSAILLLNSSLTVADTPLTLKIDSIDSQHRWIDISFYHKEERISDEEHIYTFSIISSDYLTYAIIKLDSIFTPCEKRENIAQCSLNVIKRIPTTENCYGTYGVISRQNCQDIVTTGLAIFNDSPTLCTAINEEIIRQECVGYFR